MEDILAKPKTTLFFRYPPSIIYPATVNTYNPDRPITKLRRWLGKWSYIYRYIDDARVKLKSGGVFTTDMHPYALYNPKLSSNWQHSWDDTLRALLMLRDDVAKSGKEFVVLILPDPALILHANKIRGMGFDPDYPRHRLMEHLNTMGIKTYDMFDDFQRNISVRNLQPADIFFTCDDHWNETGHRIAAEVVGEWMTTLY